MKEPDHKVKIFATQVSMPRYMQKPYWIENPVHGWLASGVKDRNGKEIYEGDKVIFGDLEQQGVIDFRDATFGIVFTRFGKENFSPLYALKDFVKIEVIGHITEDEQ